MDETHPIRSYRKSKGLSMARLATEIGVSRNTIYRWESGDRQIERRLWDVVSKTTGIPVAQLVGISSRQSAA